MESLAVVVRGFGLAALHPEVVEALAEAVHEVEHEVAVGPREDGLYREGAEVVDSQLMDIHAGGHAKSEDLRWFIRTVQPRYFIPVEGNHSFLRIHGKLAVQASTTYAML